MKRNRITFLIAELILIAIAGIFINRIFREDNPQKRVAVILPDSGNTRWEGLVNGLKQSAQVNNIHLIICNTDEIVSADDEKELIDEQLENDVDAFIICPAPGTDTKDMLASLQAEKETFVLITEDAYMAENNKIYITANELAEMLGVSVGHAYKLIRKLNQELEKEGFLVIAGKVPRRYFEKRWYGFSV